MTPSLPPHRCDPQVCLRVTSDAPLRADSGELPGSLSEALHCSAKAVWFIESLRLPMNIVGVPFLGTKWAAIRLGPMSLSEWSLALRKGTVTEVPTLTADLLVPALTDSDAEIRGWAYLALSHEPAVPDARRAHRLAHPETDRPMLPNTTDSDVHALPTGRRRPWDRGDGGLRQTEDDTWLSDE